MWIEVAIGAVAVAAVLGAVRQVSGRRRVAGAPTRDASPGAADAGAGAGAWSAQRPLDRAMPVERIERERRIGDAAFVDGLVVGHHLDPFRSGAREERKAAGPADHVPDGGDDEDPESDADLRAEVDLEAELALDLDAGDAFGGPGHSWGDPVEDGDGDDLFDDGLIDDGLGFGEGSGSEDGLDDDW